MTDDRTRRAFLATLGATTSLGLAGCTSDDSPADSESTARSPSDSGWTNRSPADGNEPGTTSGASPASRTSATTGERSETLPETTTDHGPETPSVPGLQPPDASFVDWQFDTGQQVAAAPGSGDGLVFVGTAGAPAQTPSGADVDRLLLALDAADGREQWRYPVAHNVTDRPAVVGDYVVVTTGATGIAVTDDTGMTAVSVDGAKYWRKGTPPATILETTDSLLFAGVHEGQYGTDAYPATAITAIDVASGRERWHDLFGKFDVVTERDGTLFVGTNSEGQSTAKAVAVNARTGRTRWEQSDLLLRAVTDAGLLGYRVAGDRSELVCLNVDGSERWSDTAEVSQVSAVGNGAIYAASDGKLVAYDATDGTVKWRTDVTIEWDSRAFAGDGAVYVSRGGTLTAYGADGTKRWERQVGSVRVDGIATAGTTVYVRTQRSGLVALNAKTGTTRWQLSAYRGIRGPTLGGDRLYVASEAGTVYGIPAE